MKHVHVIFLLLALTAALFSGCKDNGVSPGDRQPGLYARIVDPQGNPLAAVDVHYIFYTTTNPLVLNVMLSYDLPTSQVVTLKVFDPFGRELSTLINAQQQPAGRHSINFDSSVTNGIYSWKLQTDNPLLSQDFFIRNDDIAALIQRPPLLTSDQDGRFFLSSSLLGLGRVLGGEAIADSISIVLVMPGFTTTVETVRMNGETVVARTFTMSSQMRVQESERSIQNQ